MKTEILEALTKNRFSVEATWGNYYTQECQVEFFSTLEAAKPLGYKKQYLCGEKRTLISFQLCEQLKAVKHYTRIRIIIKNYAHTYCKH